MKRILRVFARKTNLTPVDDLAFYDVPGLFIPEGCPFDDKQDNMCAFRIPPADVLVEEYIKNWEAAKK